MSKVKELIQGPGTQNPGTEKPRTEKPFADLEHEVVADLGRADVLAVRVADAHGARGRRARVGDGARGGEGLHVEAGVEGLLAGAVEALDAVRLRVVRHQLRVLLDHQQEPGLALKKFN